MLPSARTLAAGLAVAALAAVTACGGQRPASPSDRPTVVAAFYPLQFAAEGAAGPEAAITNLTQPGAEAHDLELTPKQVAALVTADVVVYQKGFQPAVDKAIEQAQPKRVVDAAAVMRFRPAPQSDGDDHAAGPGGPDGHSHSDGHTEGDGHDHGALDPHAWLDPTNEAALTRAVATALGDARPGLRAAYAQRAEATAARLDDLDHAFATGLNDCRRREFITSHAAFGYVAARYGLEQIGVRGLSPDSEPSPARIAEVQALARRYGVTTIFSETLVSPAVAQSIAGDLGLTTDVLDPLEGLTDQARGADYVEVMQANLAALKKANQCV